MTSKLFLSILLGLFIFNSSCKKESPKEAPTLTTITVTNITSTSLICGGEIKSDGGAILTALGVCWSTNPNPTILDSKTADGIVSGVFVSSVTSLNPGTTYYIRAYATNSAGTSYGNLIKTSTIASLPTISTVALSAITSTTATGGGEVSSDGGGVVTARGVCWSINQNPTTTDSKTADGNGIGSFTSSITGLIPGTSYYFRAYATNSIGTIYGNQVIAVALAVLPTLTTNAVTLVTATAASSGGNISSDGGGVVTARGVCWSTSLEPTINDTKTSDGTGVGVYSSSITKLTPGIIYYLRAYATNNIGTVYGNQLSITTPVILPTIYTVPISSVTATSAISGGNISSDGGAAVTARGVCWNMNQDPTVFNNKSADGMGTGSYSSSITGLSPGSTYFVRSYATNSKGTVYGNQLTIKTAAVLATITTIPISFFNSTDAVSGGNITNDGGGAITARGVCWSKIQNPTITDTKTNDGIGTGSYSSSITGLSPGSTYYVRSFATNIVGTVYGNQITFTIPPILPAISTTPISSVTLTTAISGGNVTSDGGGAVTARGVCWSKIQNPTIIDTKTNDGTGTGSFSSSLTGLTPSSTYYYRAYATNSQGTSYGNQGHFFTDTALALATVVTSSVTFITTGSAILGGNVTNDGNALVVDRGIVYSTSPNPTTSDTKLKIGTGTGSFSGTVTGLSSGSVYYVRAYATNSQGTAYGNQIDFQTKIDGIMGSVADIDGNNYATVTIGTQVWMAENLKVTRYNDGTAIPLITDNSAWSNAATPGYCWYNNDESTYRNPYGALYNWYTVNTGKLCPTGWHVPTDAQWTILTTYLGDLSVVGGKLKETGTLHWNSPNTGATNEVNFSAIPGGYRTFNSTATCFSMGIGGSMWSSTSNTAAQAWERAIGHTSAAILVISAEKGYGVSVRCLKD